jgi:flagellar protein FliO/FliZ
MDLASFLRATFALAMVVGLIGLVAVALRRYAPGLLARVAARSAERRLEIVETLVLDPTRRLLLVRVDDEERVILLGEGRELDPPAEVATAVKRRSAA